MKRYIKSNSESKNKKYKIFFTDGTDTICNSARDEEDARSQAETYLRVWDIYDAEIERIVEIK